MKRILIIGLFAALHSACQDNNQTAYLLSDEFDNLTSGDLFPDVGAHTEYHYLKQAAPIGNWALTSFRNETQNSWGVQRDGEDKIIYQKKYYPPGMDYYPMLVSGDELWEDYLVEARFAPMEKRRQSGIVVRYKNDRCYYFVGVERDSAVLKIVNHGVGFFVLNEQVLLSKPMPYTEGQYLSVNINVKGDEISARFENGTELVVRDSTFRKGKVGITAGVPTKFSYIHVKTSRSNQDKYKIARNKIEEQERVLQANNPKLKLWKKLDIKGFGVGRNLRFGDLNGDGQPDVLIGQVVNHARADSYSELSCLTAMTFDGEILWRVGEPDMWKNHLTSDVAFQIHDLDNDGKNEVIYTMNFELIVADAATGKIKFKTKTPLAPKIPGHNPPLYERILGDCLFFCDLDGKGYDGNIIIKDRYRNIWALNNKLDVLWHRNLNSGHYPFAYDVDNDGKDEVVSGYSLIRHDGKLIWTFEDRVKDHADGVAIVDYKGDGNLRMLCAASDEGMIFINMKGEIEQHYFIGHVQNPVVGNFRDDLPGLETISINFWGNQGIIHFYDSDGNIYHDFEPNQYGSMLMPLNWTGGSEEFFIHNPNVDEGGIYDGFGRKVVIFPDDGHPDMCNAVLDLTGDSRDEIVVWNHEEIWVYTQDDNRNGQKLYKPQRNPLYNYSNYQATISLPGWTE